MLTGFSLFLFPFDIYWVTCWGMCLISGFLVGVSYLRWLAITLPLAEITDLRNGAEQIPEQGKN